MILTKLVARIKKTSIELLKAEAGKQDDKWPFLCLVGFNYFRATNRTIAQMAEPKKTQRTKAYKAPLLQRLLVFCV